MVLYKVNKSIPVDLDKYKMKYKIINSDKDILLIQVTLIPKYIIELCNEISTYLNMKAKSLYVNFDILQKLIKYKLINIPKNTIIIENKSNEIIINKIIDNKIVESYTVSKLLNYDTIIQNINKDFNEIYYYGLKDYNLCFKYIDFNNKLKVFKENNLLDKEKIEYINSLGVTI